MPPMEVPDAVSFVKPLVVRSAELESPEPIVSYFCLMLAVEQVLASKLHTSNAAVADFATNLLNKIESMKNNQLNNAEAKDILDSEDASQAYVLNFSTTIFEKAEKAVENRTVTKVTGATFAAAAVFLSLEAVWGPLSPDTQEKLKFAKFHAAKILKAVKNGENPNDLYKEVEPEHDTTAQDTTEHDTTEQDTTKQNTTETNTAEQSTTEQTLAKQTKENEIEESEIEESGPGLPSAPQGNPQDDLSLPLAPDANPEKDIPLPFVPEESPDGNDEQAPKPTPQPPKPAPKVYAAPKTGNKSIAEIMALTQATEKATKHAKYAISALNYDDVSTAIEQLEYALALLKSM